MAHWKIENEEWIPVMTTLSPALEAIIHLVKPWKCACERRSTNLCQCRKAGLLCTDPAAGPIMIMNVRINNANATNDGDTEDEEEDDDDDAQPYHRGTNSKKVYRLLRFSGPASLSC